jgi:hypothetical protein
LKVLEVKGIPLIVKAMKKSFEKEFNQGGYQITPEPILCSKQTYNTQCQKSLLLQLFGSVAILNLSETSCYLLTQKYAKTR